MNLATLKDKLKYLESIDIDINFTSKQLLDAIEYIKPELEERINYFDDGKYTHFENKKNIIYNGVVSITFLEHCFYGVCYENTPYNDKNSIDYVYNLIYKYLGSDNIIQFRYSNFDIVEKLLKQEHEENKDENDNSIFLEEYINISNYAINLLSSLLIELYIFHTLDNNPQLKSIFSVLSYAAEKSKKTNINCYKFDNIDVITHEQTTKTIKFLSSLKTYKETYLYIYNEIIKNQKSFIENHGLNIILLITLENLLYFYNKSNNGSFEPIDTLSTETKKFLHFLINLNYKKDKKSYFIIQEYFKYKLFASIYQIDLFLSIVNELHNFVLGEKNDTTKEQPLFPSSHLEYYPPINTSLMARNREASYNKMLNTAQRSDFDELTEMAKIQNKEEKAKQKKIANLKKQYPDITNEEAIKQIEEENGQRQNTIYDFLSLEELKQLGVNIEIIPLDKKRDKVYLKSGHKSVSLILNTEDRNLLLTYGKDALNLIMFIEAQAMLLIDEFGYNALNESTFYAINPDDYNKFCGTKNDAFYTTQKLENIAELLTRITMQINPRASYKQKSQFNFALSNVINNKQIDDKTKDLIQKKFIEKIETNFLQTHFIEKDIATNKKCVFYQLTAFEVSYIKFCKINRNFQVNRNLPLPNEKGKNLAMNIEYTLLYYLRCNKNNTKQDNKLEYKSTIKQLKDILIEQGCINVDKKHYGIFRTNLQIALDLLQKEKHISYETDAFKNYDALSLQGKRNISQEFEKEIIEIDFYNT